MIGGRAPPGIGWIVLRVGRTRRRDTRQTEVVRGRTKPGRKYQVRADHRYERPIGGLVRRGLGSGYAPDQRPSRGARGSHRTHRFTARDRARSAHHEAVAEVSPLRTGGHAVRLRRVRPADAREALVGRSTRDARDAEPSPHPIRRPAHAERDPDCPVRVSSCLRRDRRRARGGARPSPPRRGRRLRAWQGCSPRGRPRSSR